MNRPLTELQVALCMFFAAALALGQILMKLAAADVKDRIAGGVLSAALSPLLLGALAFYAVVTALWMYILSQLPLSLAYPFSLFGSALVPFMAFVFLKEQLSMHHVIGMLVVCGGLVIMYSR